MRTSPYRKKRKGRISSPLSMSPLLYGENFAASMNEWDEKSARYKANTGETGVTQVWSGFRTPYNPRLRRKKFRRAGMYADIMHVRYSPEVKYIVNNATATNILDTGTFILMNGLVQGITQSTRLGSQIQVTSVNFRGFIANQYAGPAIVRAVLLIDKVPQNAQFALADLLFNSGNPLTSNINMANRERFLILFDKVFTFSDTGATEVQTFSFRERLGFKCQYNANNGTIADITKNAIYLLLLGDQAADYPDISYSYETYYTDS